MLVSLERARVGARGQAVIPKRIREALGIRPGDDVVFTLHGGHAHVRPLDTGAWDALWDAMSTYRLPDGFDVDAEVEAGMEGASDASLR